MNGSTSAIVAYAIITLLLWGYAAMLYLQGRATRTTRKPE